MVQQLFSCSKMPTPMCCFCYIIDKLTCTCLCISKYSGTQTKEELTIFVSSSENL